LIASNTQGCLDSVTQILVVDEDIFLNVPNVFTPNGDGKNDSFFIDSKGLSTLNVLIFNRWGTMIYEINSLNGVWDGKTSSGDAPDGTYFFVLKAKSDGGRDFEQTGYLLLSR
jgi:gliding motility-associated-like protein